MLEYNVWVYNINKQKIEKYNVFYHCGFYREVENLLKNDRLSIEDFSEKVKMQAMYYFWSKTEWEIVIRPWCGCRDVEKAAKKIDVYDQLIINWNNFIKYIWNNKQEVIGYE